MNVIGPPEFAPGAGAPPRIVPGPGEQAEEVAQRLDDEAYDRAQRLSQPFEESFYPHVSLS